MNMMVNPQQGAYAQQPNHQVYQQQFNQGLVHPPDFVNNMYGQQAHSNAQSGLHQHPQQVHQHVEEVDALQRAENRRRLKKKKKKKKKQKSTSSRKKRLKHDDEDVDHLSVASAAASDNWIEADVTVKAKPKPKPVKPSVGRNGTSTSTFRGVSCCGKDRKWQARIRDAAKVRYLGRFPTEVEAALEYDDAARKCKGLNARCNFRLLLPEERAAVVASFKANGRLVEEFLDMLVNKGKKSASKKKNPSQSKETKLKKAQKAALEGGVVVPQSISPVLSVGGLMGGGGGQVVGGLTTVSGASSSTAAIAVLSPAEQVRKGLVYPSAGIPFDTRTVGGQGL